MMRHISYFGNPWVGIFLRANDSFALLPKDALEKLKNKVRDFLDVEILQVSIADSNLLGVYTAINNNGLVLPNLTTDSEMKGLNIGDLNVYRSPIKMNAHGNNLAVNDRIGLVNPDIDKDEIKRLEDVLGVELLPTEVAGFKTPGSALLLGNKGFVAHYRATEEEIKRLEDILNLHGVRGTVNSGTGFVSLGVIANKKGYLVGEQTTAFEMGRIEEGLGYI